MNPISFALSMPFDGLAWQWQTILYVVLITAISMLLWTTDLFLRGRRARRHAPEPDELGANRFSWVFLVPALNEEMTIADTVHHLLALPLERRTVVVIDDASDDNTARLLAEIEHDDLTVLRREKPEARTGKAATLNLAYSKMDDYIGDADRAEVITVVVDADGRINEHAPRYVAAHFADDERVGGVQSQVRIYNRKHLLTWFQDIEFGSVGNLFQLGRTGWGTAAMGGNGQYNRLSALDDVSDENGPWRNSLAEDQDLGLRLIIAGWDGRQEVRATVEQQGLPKLRPLLRQRTRWSQGNLQSLALLDDLMHARHPLLARFETCAYLLIPLWQSIIGVGMLVALYLLVTGVAPVWAYGGWWQIVFFYILGFGGTVMGSIASRANRGPKGYLAGFFIGHVYAYYSWMIWPVLIRSVFRQLTERRDWIKTERVPVEDELKDEFDGVEEHKAA
ncbi:MAG: glycosyltransferase family 2 protein [Actinobacteria bacterium]|nr:glycosyltransferase family 2 protein [Actinomycetota bacterium]